MIVWTAGYNFPGYLPKSEPMIFETRYEAVEWMISELHEHASRAEEIGDTDEAGSADTFADELRAHDADVDGEWLSYVGNLAYWIECQDLPLDEIPEHMGGTLIDY